MYCDLWLQYIKVRKLFKGGNYLRAETIRGNTVYKISNPSISGLEIEMLAKVEEVAVGDLV